MRKTIGASALLIFIGLSPAIQVAAQSDSSWVVVFEDLVLSKGSPSKDAIRRLICKDTQAIAQDYAAGIRAGFSFTTKTAYVITLSAALAQYNANLFSTDPNTLGPCSS